MSFFLPCFRPEPKSDAPYQNCPKKDRSYLARNCFNLRKTLQKGFKLPILIKRPFSRDESSKK